MFKKTMLSIVGIIAFALLFSPFVYAWEKPSADKIVDLTNVLDDKGPSFWEPREQYFEHKRIANYEEGFNVWMLKVVEHYGTHMDAPSHRVEGKDYGLLPDIPFTRLLFVPAVVIDVSAKAERDNDYLVTVDDFKAWEKKYGYIPPGVYVLMNSGWGKRWSTPERYNNKDAQGTMHFPGISKEACEFLVKERDIVGVGTDVYCPDYGLDFGKNWPAHQVLLGGGKLILEQIQNLDKLPPKGATLLVCPLKVAGASGGQIRLFAILP